MWNRVVPYLCVADENQEKYLSYRGPIEEQGIPAPHRVPQPKIPVLKREVPTHFGYENQQRSWLGEVED